MRIPFESIFKMNADGSLTLRLTVRVAGITLAAGNQLYTGQVLGGIDFTRYVGHELEAETEGDIYVIKAIY